MDLEIIEKELGVGRGTSIFLSQTFDDLSSMRKFLSPRINDFTPPHLLPNIDHLTDYVLLAIDNGDGIFVWGHDDIDGHTSTAVMVKTLRMLNARVDYHIPDKRKEGYFIPEEWLERIKNDGYKTMLTVDFGSSSEENFDRCRKAGVNLLVTDHHEVLTTSGVQVNPKMPDSRYPEKNLAGVGVSIKIAQHLATNILGTSIEEFYEINKDLLIHGFLGSVADRAPLEGENRIIILLGLEEFKRSNRPWVKALREDGPLGFNQIINRIIPILASARGAEGVNFYLCSDYEQAKDSLSIFKAQQRTWQIGYSRYLPAVLRSVKVYPKFAVAIVPNIPLEFLGSFANRLKEEFQRPAMVATNRNGDWSAELRGRGSVDLVKKLSVLKQEFLDFGGHPLACGLTFLDQALDRITEKIIEISETFESTDEKIKEIELPIIEIEESLKRIFPLPREVRFLSSNSTIKGGLVDDRKVIWNVTPPQDGRYDLIYFLDEDLNIFIKEVQCRP